MKDTKTEIADFAGGCFWNVEEFFRKMPGVVKTEVGYEGGHVKDPSYEMVCSHTTGHAETTKVEFDPKQITYEQLVRKFLAMHPPSQLNGDIDDNDNYRTAIFYRNENQKQIAEQVIAQLNEKVGKQVRVQLAPAADFYRAEDYHQQFYAKLRQK